MNVQRDGDWNGNAQIGTAYDSQPLHADANEMLRALRLLTDPGQVVEIRLLNVALAANRVPVTISGYFDDYDAFIGEVQQYDWRAKGIYVTLNPVNNDLAPRAWNRLRIVGKDDRLTTDAGIVSRHWLPIDLDPVRASGISSTEEEHNAALERALTIRDALREEGWPDPLYRRFGEWRASSLSCLSSGK